MHGLETINAMNLGTVVKEQAPAPVTANSVFTVIWQGINEVVTQNGSEDDITTFMTEVTPDHYGYVEVPTSREIWGSIACGEQFDGGNPFDEIEVLYVIEHAVIELELDDRTDE